MKLKIITPKPIAKINDSLLKCPIKATSTTLNMGTDKLAKIFGTANFRISLFITEPN